MPTCDLILALDSNRCISQCIRQISHKALFCNGSVHTCVLFSHKMVHCGLWSRRVVRFVILVYSHIEIGYKARGTWYVFSMQLQWRPFIARFIIANILYSSILISLHNMLPFELIKDTSYLALSGELWSVFYEYFNRNWSCYRGFLLYTTPGFLYRDITTRKDCCNVSIRQSLSSCNVI